MYKIRHAGGTSNCRKPARYLERSRGHQNFPFIGCHFELEYGLRNEPIKPEDPYPQPNPVMSPKTAHIFIEDEGDLGEIARWTLERHPYSQVVNKVL